MKKIIVGLLVVCSCFLLTGCVNNGLTVNNFENMLKENNITFEKIENENPREGLKKEYNYYFNDDSMLKLFVFDTNSDLYKQAKKDNMIDEVGVDAKIAVTLNENLGISFEGNSNYKVLIKDQFEKIKLK